MQKKCSVLGCEKTDKSQRMFSFPRAKYYEKLLTWIKCCGDRALFKGNIKHYYKSKFVCGLHFTKTQLSNRCLPNNAIPSLNLPVQLDIPLNLKKQINLSENRMSIKDDSTVSNDDFNDENTTIQLNFNTINNLKDDYDFINNLNQSIALGSRIDDKQNELNNNYETINEMEDTISDDDCFVDSLDNSKNINGSTPLHVTSECKNPSNIIECDAGKQCPSFGIENSENLPRGNVKKYERKTSELKYCSQSKPNSGDSIFDSNEMQNIKKQIRKEQKRMHGCFDSFNPHSNPTFSDSIIDNEIEWSMKFHDYASPDINLICRLCGIVQDNELVLFDIFNNEKHKIFEMMKKSFPDINIIKSHKLPNNACKTCVRFLKYVSSFLNTIKRADRNLKNIFRCENNEVEELILSNDQADIIPIEETNNSMVCDNTSQHTNKLTIKLQVERNKSNYQFYCPFCLKNSKTKGKMISHIALCHINEKKSIKNKRQEKKHKIKKNESVPALCLNIKENQNEIMNVTHQDLQMYEEDNNLNLLTTSNNNILIEDILMDLSSDHVNVNNDTEIILNHYHNEIDLHDNFANDSTIKDEFLSLEKLKCFECNKSFKSLSSKQIHENTKHGVVVECYKCVECLQVFANTIQLAQHNTLIHRTNNYLDANKVKCTQIRYLFNCEHCCSLFTHFKDILAHKNTCVLLKCGKYMCYCMENVHHFKFNEHWLSHESVINPLLERPSCKMLYICEFCYLQQDTHHKITSHINSKHSMEIAKRQIQSMLNSVDC